MLHFLITDDKEYDLLSPNFLMYNGVKMEVSFRDFFSLQTSSSISLNFVDIGWPSLKDNTYSPQITWLFRVFNEHTINYSNPI